MSCVENVVLNRKVSVSSSIPNSLLQTENKKRKEKVQIKKEESKEQSTYADILKKNIYGKKVQDQSEKEN